jgi:hypothetical protein
LVSKNLTITVTDQLAHWARKKAAEQNRSVSQWVGRILENKMRLSDGYWRAYRRWQKIGGIKGIDAARRLTRQQAHERRR